MLWLIFAVLTAGAVICVLWPLSKFPRTPTRRDIGVAIYRAQLAEIERDEAQRIVSRVDAQSAKVEAARRLLTADAAAEKPPAAPRTRARLASFAVLIFVPALSLTVYATIGHPDLPDAPLAARLQSSPPERLDLAAAIAKVEAHLTQHPDDGRGYEVLAPVYLRVGRVGDAVNAARRALRLLGESPSRQALYGETMAAAANGIVTPEAERLFEAAAAADPSAAKPRFFLGLSAEQRGDKDRAMKLWSGLAAAAPQDSPLAQALRERIAALSTEPEKSQSDLTARLEAPRAAGQMNTIRAMVDGLAARLAQKGNDLEGWLRLVRSYTVLHETGKARNALVDAKRNLVGDPNAIARLEALARELGLEG
jgi:cytochrome c-type biogenesis protein CcmH